ncbi:hypothetical protein [Gloeothece verrucosa]|uniref:hypothetical protein n=1 Tax=Gloeothece verrucosa TaxID=2546359 RepID=UPI0003191F44|nr:hypothetical protein [Gloeothece verrucosa]
MGKPTNKPRDKQIRIFIDAQTFEAIQTKMKAENLSISTAAYQLIKKALEA